MSISNVVILGGAGFVGYNLAIYLKNIGYNVTVADNLVRRGSEVSLENLLKNKIKFIHCDIRNKEDFLNLPKDIDIVLNCAAQPSAINYSNPEFDITNNTNAVVNILEYCRKKELPLIFWSTNKCYSGDLVNSVPRTISNKRYVWSDPLFKMDGWTSAGFSEKLSVDGNDHSIYGVSKIAADLIVQEWSSAFGIPAICNRFSCLAGPNQWGKAEQGWVAWFAIANELELPIDIFGFDGYQVRDCLFTEDLNNLISKQIYNINKYKDGIVFNVGGGITNSISILEAINFLELNNKKFTNINIDLNLRRADQAIYISDIHKVSSEFDWKPRIDIEQGYNQILSWVKDNKNQLERLYKI